MSNFHSESSHWKKLSNHIIIFIPAAVRCSLQPLSADRLIPASCTGIPSVEIKTIMALSIGSGSVYSTSLRVFQSNDRSHPLWTGNIMALFQSRGRVKLYIFGSSNRTKYGIISSPTSFGISPDIHSVHIDLFLPIVATLFVMTLTANVKGSSDLAHCIGGCYPHRWIPKNNSNLEN